MGEMINVYGNLVVGLQGKILFVRPTYKLKGNFQLGLKDMVYDVDWIESVQVS
jgi:hypothetical protein